MSDTKQVTGIVHSVTEATSVNGTYWKVALPPPTGLKYPQIFNINKPEWMEGVKAGVNIALDVKRGKAKKANPEYESDFYWDVQGVRVLKAGGPSDTGGTEPWPGEELTKPSPEAPKKPVAPAHYMPVVADAKDRQIARAVALKAAVEFLAHYPVPNDNQAFVILLATATEMEKWLTR